jgi:hypothetical protein
MTEDEFTALVPQRLNGQRRSVAHIDGLASLVGFRSDFRLAWFATRLNLFTVVACAPSADQAALERYCDAALDYAIAEKGRFRGLQSAVGVISVLASQDVHESAIRFARATVNRRFAAFAWPILFDLNSSQYYGYEGSSLLGRVYNDWMRTRASIALPGSVAVS